MFFVFLSVDLPEDSDDFEPSMDVTFDDALYKLMEAESIPPVVEEGICNNDLDDNGFSTGS